MFVLEHHQEATYEGAGLQNIQECLRGTRNGHALGSFGVVFHMVLRAGGTMLMELHN